MKRYYLTILKTVVPYVAILLTSHYMTMCKILFVEKFTCYFKSDDLYNMSLNVLYALQLLHL